MQKVAICKNLSLQRDLYQGIRLRILLTHDSRHGIVTPGDHNHRIAATNALRSVT
jgi:hypothetical protein